MRPNPLRQYLRRRDRRSFTRLVEAERDLVLGAAMRLLGDRAHAEDATQEVFMSLLPPNRPDDGPEYGRAWLVERTISVARDLSRSDRRRRAREASRVDVTPLEPELSPAECAELREAVEGLPRPLRACVELRYFGGLAAREVADALGLARRTVDERLVEARKQLRTGLSGAAGASLSAALLPGWGAPRSEPSAALTRRLDALALLAGEATLVGGAGMWAAGAGAIALAVAATMWVRGHDTVEPGGAAVPAVRQDEATNVDELANLTPVTGGVERTIADSTPGEGDTPAKVPDFTPAFTIEVVDQDGALVRSGTLVIAIPRRRRGPGPPAGPASGPWTLGPRSLADGNPVHLPDLPAELENTMVQARAFADGYGSARPAFIDERREETQFVRLILPPPRDLQLEVVVNGTEDSVPNALVIATTELERLDVAVRGLATPVDGRFVVRTDALGRCRLVGLGGGQATIEVHAKGYRTRDVGGLVPGTSQRVVVVPDKGTGAIEVLVTGPEGEPVSDFEVRCGYMSMSGSYTMRTDVAGIALFEGLTAGHYIADLDASEFSARGAKEGWPSTGFALEKRVSIPDSGVTRVSLGFVQGDATWHIELVDADGIPVPERRVTLSKNVEREGVTDGSGLVTFSGLEAGAWYFSVADGWAPGAHLLKKGQTLRTRMVIGDRRVTGTVKLEDGTPLVGASLAFGDRYMASATTDEDGYFSLEGAPPGEYHVHAHSYGHPGLTTKLVIEPGLDPPLLELVVPPGGRLVVSLPGSARRRLSIAAVSEEGQKDWLQPDATATERYTSPPLAPGNYTLLVRKGGKVLHETTERLMVRAGGTTEATVLVPE